MVLDYKQCFRKIVGLSEKALEPYGGNSKSDNLLKHTDRLLASSILVIESEQARLLMLKDGLLLMVHKKGSKRN